MRTFWVILAIVMLLATVTYFALISSKFKISKIQVAGNVKTKTEDIEKFAFQEVNNRMLFADTKKLESKILDNFPQIESVDATKKFPDEIVIKIKEREAVAGFCQQEQCFLIDKNGVVFEPLGNIPDNFAMIKKSEDIGQIFTGENVVEEKLMKIIYDIQNDLKVNFNIDTKEALVSNPLIFKTSEGWQIYFNPDNEINSQIVKMNALLKDGIPSSDRKKLQYIYLQYKDKAYYK